MYIYIYICMYMFLHMHAHVCVMYIYIYIQYNTIQYNIQNLALNTFARASPLSGIKCAISIYVFLRTPVYISVSYLP